MQVDPYSIYVDHRPLKVAFLADPAEGLVWVDRVIAYNRERWGGRYNPIVLTDGEAIADDQWRFLRHYDPDVVKASVTLGEDVRKQIRVFLSPLSVELFRPGDDHLDLRTEPISLLPDRQLVSQIARDFSDRPSALVLFDVAENASPAIKDFIGRNFGILDPEHQVVHMKRALDEVKTERFEISDEASLNQALLDLGDYRRVVFPSQLCALPNFLDDVRSTRNGEGFAVVIGDSANELVYAWNRTLTIPRWLRTGITQLWLPASLATEPTIRPGLTKFLNRFVDATGNQGQRGAHFITFSLKENEIRSIAETLGAGLRFWKTAEVFSAHPIPTREEGGSFSVKKGPQLYRADNTEEHLVLNDPNVPVGSMGGQHWIADVAIQLRPERFTSIGKDYWWRLPNRTNVLSETGFFNRAARVGADRGLSVLMSHRSAFGADPGTLIVKLPNDHRLAYALICGERFDQYEENQDWRLSRPYDEIEYSDKGMYLAGVLSLFPDLLNANSVFEDRFWRGIFARMANQIDRKDSLKKAEIILTLKKHLPDLQAIATSDEQQEWWAERVLSIAKDYSKEEKELSYDELLKEAAAETNEFNALHSDQPPFEVDEDDFKQTISGLLSWNVLLHGLRPKCPRCGYRIWYHLDKASQTMTCEGCRYEFTLQAEERWHYRLNSLVRAAVSSHGTVPLLLVLGQLQNDARTSFMFSPCLNLFRHSGDDQQHVGELDLVCIVDGRFTIGEVKNSIGLFTTGDFDGLATIAKAIKPDVVLFSALDGKPTTFVKKNIDRVRKELEPLEIDVRWYALHDWVTEPRPVR